MTGMTDLNQTLAERSKLAAKRGVPRRRLKRSENMHAAMAGDRLVPEEIELLRQLCKGYKCVELMLINGKGKRRTYWLYERLMIKSDAANDAQLGAWAQRKGYLL